VLPIAKALGLMLDFAIAMVVVLAVMAVYGVGVSSMAFLVPLFLLLAMLTAFGAGTLFAAINVRYRDVSVIVPVLLQIWIFASPVIYPGSLVSGPLQYVWALNPMVSVLDGTRWSLLGASAPDPLMVAISVASALTVLVVAIVYFRRTEQFFADVI
jgi:lipopolysaccharide transport system permease protein